MDSIITSHSHSIHSFEFSWQLGNVSLVTCLSIKNLPQQNFCDLNFNIKTTMLILLKYVTPRGMNHLTYCETQMNQMSTKQLETDFSHPLNSISHVSTSIWKLVSKKCIFRVLPPRLLLCTVSCEYSTYESRTWWPHTCVSVCMYMSKSTWLSLYIFCKTIVLYYAHACHCHSSSCCCLFIRSVYCMLCKMYAEDSCVVSVIATTSTHKNVDKNEKKSITDFHRLHL